MNDHRTGDDHAVGDDTATLADVVAKPPRRRTEHQITKEVAEDFTANVGNLFGTGFKFSLQAWELGVPQALGLTHKEWVEQRLGGYIKLPVADRKEAVKELAGRKMSQAAIGDVLGVHQTTVSKDLADPEDKKKHKTQAQETDKSMQNHNDHRQTRAKEEAEFAADIDAMLANNPAQKAEFERGALRVAVHRRLVHLMEVVILKPEAIGNAADDDLRQSIAIGFPKLRKWMDDVEKALPTGLRRVV